MKHNIFINRNDEILVIQEYSSMATKEAHYYGFKYLMTLDVALMEIKNILSSKNKITFITNADSWLNFQSVNEPTIERKIEILEKTCNYSEIKGC